MMNYLAGIKISGLVPKAQFRNIGGQNKFEHFCSIRQN